MTARTVLDIVRPKTGQLDRMSLIRAPSRDPGHMTFSGVRLRMRSRYTASRNQRRQTAFLHTHNLPVQY